MHYPRLPTGRSRHLRKLAGKPGGLLAAGQSQGVAQGGDLTRFHGDRALREPTDGLAERLLSQFDSAADFRGLHEDKQEPFVLRGSRDGGKDRFHCGGHQEGLFRRVRL